MIIGKTTARGYPECRGSTIYYPCYCELKLDGELNYYESAKNWLVNKSGKTRTQCPITNELWGAYPTLTLIGELYYRNGVSGSLYPFLSNQKSHDLMYCVFDIVDYHSQYETRRTLLLDMVKETDHVKIVPTWYIEDMQQLDDITQQVWGNGYEGLVIKRPDSLFRMGVTDWIKIKKKDTNAYKVTLIDPNQERIEVEVGSMAGVRNVGVKVMNKDKATLKIGDMVNIQHQGILTSGSLRHPVYKGLTQIGTWNTIRKGIK